MPLGLNEIMQVLILAFLKNYRLRKWFHPTLKLGVWSIWSDIPYKHWNNQIYNVFSYSALELPVVLYGAKVSMLWVSKWIPNVYLCDDPWCVIETIAQNICMIVVAPYTLQYPEFVSGFRSSHAYFRTHDWGLYTVILQITARVDNIS